MNKKRFLRGLIAISVPFALLFTAIYLISSSNIKEEYTIEIGQEVTGENFLTLNILPVQITNGYDNIDKKMPGTYDIKVKYTIFSFDTKLIIEDLEPPVIDIPDEIYVELGNGISYKNNLVLTENSSAEPTLVIDNSAVDTQNAGVYPVTYTAIDLSGNQATKTIEIVIESPEIIPEEIILDANAIAANEILEGIITDDMSQYDIVEAIFYWTWGNIGYGNTEHTTYEEAAHSGLVGRYGDCLVYAATAKVLLTQAGIKNMDIEKIPSSTEHYWNLIDIGEGWQHFDATRRKDGSQIFLWSDEKLIEYSNANNLSHNYDKDLYPEIS